MARAWLFLLYSTKCRKQIRIQKPTFPSSIVLIHARGEGCFFHGCLESELGMMMTQRRLRQGK